MTMENVILTPLASDLLRALKLLEAGYQAHPCGGFTTDDMQWRLGIAFTLESDLTAAIEELEEQKLIRYAGFDESDGIGHCYEVVNTR